MRLGVTQHLGPRLEQTLDDLHLALYNSYVIGHAARHGPHSPVPALSAPARPKRPLKELREGWRAIPLEHRTNEHVQLIVRTALWNLLGIYEKDDPPEDFTKLLADELDFEIARARELREEPGYSVFPPVRGRLVRDSSFTADADATAPSSVQASLTVSLDRDFDELRKVVHHPTSWPKRFPLFWGGAEMTRRDDGWHGGLSLPGKLVSNVMLKKENIPSVEPTESRTTFIIADNPYVRGRLSFRMVAEPSRPGWTHIIHKRNITFSAHLGAPEVPTLSYWTKSDIACLALGS